MNFLDLFSGIGGFRLGLEKAGHKCIGFCEIDKYARATYKANFDTKGEWESHDITTVTSTEIERIRDERTIDLICGGFPCQAFSIAGKRLGFDDTRGTLFFEVCRFISIIKPKIVFLENVKGLLSHNNGATFLTIIDTLGQLGYDVEWQVLNSKNYGVPQNRERVFIIGHSRNGSGRKVFPIRRANSKAIKQIGNIADTGNFINPQRGRVYNVDGVSPCLNTCQGGGLEPKVFIDLSRENPKITNNARCLQARYAKGISNRTGETSGVLTVNKMVIPVLTPDREEKRQNGRRFKTDGEPMFTITAQDRHGVAIYQIPRGNNKGGVHDTAPTVSANCYQNNNLLMNRNKSNMRIRRLTPKECFRLQGFPDSHYHNAKEAGISDSQLYKQAGNSVTVNVIYEIAKKVEVI